MIDEKELDKLADIPMPWKEKGFKDVKSYILDLTDRWSKINDLVKSGEGDKTIVKSTLIDTLQFIAWAHTKREMNASVAMVRALLDKHRMKHGKFNKGKTARFDEGGDVQRLQESGTE